MVRMSAAGIRHAATASRSNPGVNTRLSTMPGSNAGVKRNRLPRGVEPTRPDIRLHPDTGDAYVAAARASGNLSVSLYLERLRARYEAEFGALPVFDDSLEVAHTAA
jgi:hypothetical protein